MLENTKEEAITVGKVTLSVIWRVESSSLTVDKRKSVSLILTELTIMELLIKNPNTVISREDIKDAICRKTGKKISGRGVDTIVSNIRKKFGWHPSEGPINTIHGAGYILGLNS